MNPTLRRCMAPAAVVVRRDAHCRLQSVGRRGIAHVVVLRGGPPPDPPITTTVPSPVPTEVNTVGLHSSSRQGYGTVGRRC